MKGTVELSPPVLYDRGVVVEARDGQEAVELALQLQPDIVVMDVSMPRLNGVEATQRITAQLRHVRVFALSMHETREMSQAMIEAGAAAYLRKDAPSELLLATILNWSRSAGILSPR